MLFLRSHIKYSQRHALQLLRHSWLFYPFSSPVDINKHCFYPIVANLFRINYPDYEHELRIYKRMNANSKAESLMSRPALSEDVEHEVRKSWAQDPFQTADQVWRSVRIENERGKWFPSLRKVQYIVRDAKQARPHVADEPEFELWGPDWPDDSEDIACLLRLKLQSLKHPEMPLTTRVGKWALRLRAGFLGPMEDPTVDPDLELLCFAYEYTLRERVAELFQDGLYTPDLDGAMMCRPCESVERIHQYQRSVVAGLFPAHRPASLFHLSLHI